MRPAAPYRIARGLVALRRFARDTGGNATVEFALLAPVMLMITLATFDLGKAISDRMAMDAALRNGLQVAMTTGSVSDTLSVMRTTADAELGAGQAAFQVNQVCTCGSVYAARVSCTSICTGPEPTSVYLQLQGQYSHDSWILPNIQLSPMVYLQQR